MVDRWDWLADLLVVRKGFHLAVQWVDLLVVKLVVVMGNCSVETWEYL